MLIPAAMFIESASDGLKSVPDAVKKDQQNELTSFGGYRAQQLGASGLSNDFRKGYELGLQTARTIIQGSTALALKGVNPDNVL